MKPFSEITPQEREARAIRLYELSEKCANKGRLEKALLFFEEAKAQLALANREKPGQSIEKRLEPYLELAHEWGQHDRI